VIRYFPKVDNRISDAKRKPQSGPDQSGKTLTIHIPLQPEETTGQTVTAPLPLSHSSTQGGNALRRPKAHPRKQRTERQLRLPAKGPDILNAEEGKVYLKQKQRTSTADHAVLRHVAVVGLLVR
jgi:hypothetical protein